MKKLNFILLISFIFLSFSIYGQDEDKNYPFNEAVKIEIFIFENHQPVNDEWNKLVCGKIQKVNGKIDASKFVELKELNIFEIENLRKTVNFQKNNCSENIYKKQKCNENGYGVVFYDKSNRILEYFGLCFNCQEFQISSEKMKLGLMCPDKFLEFEKLFNELGFKLIKYRNE